MISEGSSEAVELDLYHRDIDLDFCSALSSVVVANQPLMPHQPTNSDIEMKPNIGELNLSASWLNKDVVGYLIPVAIAMGFSMFECASAEHAGYVFQGFGQWKTFQYEEMRESHDIHFTAYANYGGVGSWLIEFGYETKYIEGFVSGTDGSNAVTVAKYKPQFTNSINAYAYVERATIPRGDSCLPLSAIWLAFCAPAYLDGLTVPAINPPYFKDAQPDRCGYNFEVEFALERSTETPGFIERMHFLHNGKSLNHGRQWVEAPKPFNRGFTNAIFMTSRFADEGLDGILYPVDFKLDYFYPLASPKNPKRYMLYLVQSFEATVTNVAEATVPSDLFPEIPRRVNYLDRRFMTSETPEMRLAYSSDNYLSDDEVRKHSEFQVAQQRQKALRKPVPLGRYTPQGWAMLIVAVLILVPVWVMVAQKKRKETTK